MTTTSEAARRLLAAALAAVALWPLAYLLHAAVPVLGQGDWLAHFASTTLAWQAANSLWVAVVAALVAFAAGAVPALLLARFSMPGRGLLVLWALLPLLFAPSVTASTWMVVSSADLFVSRLALAFHLGWACSPYVFVIFRVAASRVPSAYGEMAAALGLNARQRLWRVHVPAYAVPTAAGLLIVFAQSLGDYAAAERLGIQTLSVGIHNLWLGSQSSQVAAIVSTVLTLPTLLLVVVAAWVSTSLISQNPVAAAAAAAARRPLAPGGWVAVHLYSLAWALPFFAAEWVMVDWAISRWSRTRFEAIPGDLCDSALTAVCASALVFGVCALAVLLLRTGARSKLAERMPWLFLANYFLPSLVLALAFVMMTRDGSVAAQWLGSLRDTRLVIVVPLALRLLPFAMLPVLDALRRTPPAMIEMARVYGRGPLRARLVAFAGQVAPALALGCALVFMEAVKELDLSLTLQPFGYSTLALKIYAFSRHQNMDRAAVWVLLSQALMLAPLLLLWWRVGRLDQPART